jgi:uncharacterized protein
VSRYETKAVIIIFISMGIQDRIKEIEEEISRTQKNKKTEYHLGLLKARLAKLRVQQSQPQETSANQDNFEVQKSGDARVTLIGFPSVGKSTLLTKLTKTHSISADYAFTTLSCISGKVDINGAQIQLLDLPGIIEEASKNRGKGRQVIAVARTSDLILMVLGREKRECEILENELGAMGIRLNEKKPEISFQVTQYGGININCTAKLTKTSVESIRAILKGFKMNNCHILIKEDVTDDQVIDVVSGRAVYVPCIFCYNKADEYSLDQLNQIEPNETTTVVSSKMEWNLDGLSQMIYDKLDLVRVYTKKKGIKPDLNTPMIVRHNGTIRDLCLSIHKDFLTSFRYAMVWGTSVKHNPQKVGITHVPDDEDVIEIILN